MFKGKKPALFVFAAALPLLALTPAAQADHDNSKKAKPTGLVKEVLIGTRRYRDPQLAEAEGWMSVGSCVSSAEKGAMGVHYVNFGLIGDGALDPRQPEALVYEPKKNRARLVAAEFIVTAEAWHATNPPEVTPVLMGQLFHRIDAPNRYGLPDVYVLHVWAWRDNPNGMFSNWHPKVSCESFPVA
jgi:hypothetical protein